MPREEKAAPWLSFLSSDDDSEPPPLEALRAARAEVAAAREAEKATSQQLELMTAMLHATEEELKLRSNQLEITNEMLRATEAELIRNDEVLGITKSMLSKAEEEIQAQARTTAELQKELESTRESLSRALAGLPERRIGGLAGASQSAAAAVTAAAAAALSASHDITPSASGSGSRATTGRAEWRAGEHGTASHAAPAGAASAEASCAPKWDPGFIPGQSRGFGLSASDRSRPSSEKPRVDTNAVEAVHKGVDARGNQPSLETLLPKPALLPVDLAEQRLTHLQPPAPRIVIENADKEESMGGR